MLFDQRAGGISARRSNGVVTLMTTPPDFADLAVLSESGLLGLAVDPAFKHEPLHLHLSESQVRNRGDHRRPGHPVAGQQHL
jgi:hypothetical protein